MMNFVLKMMNFVLKMMNFVLKMMKKTHAQGIVQIENFGIHFSKGSDFDLN